MRTLILSALLMSGCAAELDEYAGGGSHLASGDASGTSGVSSATGDTSAGAALYADNCASCHGSAGGGGSAPNIAGISDSAGVIDTILYGTSGMPGFASSLTDQEIADILAYLGGLTGGGGGGGDDEDEGGED